MRAKIINEENFERDQDPKRAMRIGDMGMNDKIKGIGAFTHWLYNVDPHFIQQVWGEGTMLSNHIQEKFNGILKKSMESYMDPNSLMKLIRELDTSNEKLLFKYIIENHSDKW